MPEGACHHPVPLIEAPLVAALAQLVEHIIRNDGVTGSSPEAAPATPHKTLKILRILLFSEQLAINLVRPNPSQSGAIWAQIGGHASNNSSWFRYETAKF